MNKIIAIVLFCGTVLFICCYATIDRHQNELKDNRCFTVKETYNLFNDEKMLIKVYDNQKDSLIPYADMAEGYLVSIDETNICKVKILDVNIYQQVLLDEKIYNEYSLTVEVEVNEISINDCILKLIYPNHELRFPIGEINVMVRPDSLLTGVRQLYGISFDEPFLSLGGIIIEIQNNSSTDLKFDEIFLGGSHSVGWEELENLVEESTKITDVCDYQYDVSKTCAPLEIKAHSSKTLLLKIGYENNFYLKETPIFFRLGKEIKYIDTFCFITTNELNGFKNLIYEGYLYEF